MGFRISRKQKEIIIILGKSLVLASALLAPNIVQILRPKNTFQKHRYKKSLQKLIDNKIVYLSGEEIKLTERGRKLQKFYEIEGITIAQSEKWDEQWHIVCYDIPEFKRKEREYFRSKLVELGFRFVQKSLWVYPHECKEEIAIIAQNLGIAPFVSYLNTDYLPQQQKLLRYFDLQSS